MRLSDERIQEYRTWVDHDVKRLLSHIDLLQKEADWFRGTLELIQMHAKSSIVSTEEECDMSANWVERRCSEALKKSPTPSQSGDKG